MHLFFAGDAEHRNVLFRGAVRLYKRKIADLGEHQTIAQNIDLAEFGCAGLWDAWMER